jgi:Holliday junction DNA helicase RuvA
VITRITGKLIQLSEDAATLEVGAFEYQVLIPEFVRRQLQSMLDKAVSLRTLEYLEGNPQKGRVTPRMVGFMNNAEREFFELFCSVDGVGVKTALRAMVRPVREVARAIEEQSIDELRTLPGIGPAAAERIIAKLRRKMPRFALMVDRELPPDLSTDEKIINETYAALVSLGHTSTDARHKIEAATGGGAKKFKSVEDLLTVIYRREQA